MNAIRFDVAWHKWTNWYKQ